MYQFINDIDAMNQIQDEKKKIYKMLRCYTFEETDSFTMEWSGKNSILPISRSKYSRYQNKMTPKHLRECKLMKIV